MFKGKLAAIFFLLICFGCGSNREEKAGLKIVRINLVDEPHTLDPRLARDPHAQMLMRMFFEGLTRIGPDDRPHLALAKSVEISEDLKRYTFTLREARWTNGDLVKAADFVYSWKKMLSPNFAADNAYQLYLIKNGKGVNEGKISHEELGVKALDDRTLVVEIEYATPYFLELLAMPFYYPIHERVDKETPNWAQKSISYVSNGPFSLEKWGHHSEILAKKNPLYWDAESVKIDGVNLIMVDSDTEMKLFEQKKLQWMGSPLSTISVDALPSLYKEGKLYVKPRAETSFLRLNTTQKVLQSAMVRRALALAIDRGSIVEHVLQGGQLPALRLVPPSMQLQNAPYFSDHSQNDASSLLSEGLEALGLTKEALSDLSFLYIHSERGHLIAQAIQQQWYDVFGVRIRIEATERKVYFDRISHRDYDIAFCSWGADFHDPVNFLEVFKYRDQSTNNTNWEDEEYTDTLNASFLMGNEGKRVHLLARCEQILMEAMPIVPIFHYSMLYRKEEGLNQVFLSSLGQLDFKWATLENAE